jgi:hypothetical protein
MANATASVISKAAQTLEIPLTSLTDILLKAGVPDDDIGYKLLKAKTTTETYLADLLRKGFPDTADLKVFAAASILKGNDPFEEESIKEIKDAPTIILEALTANRTPAQMKDQELLELYAKDRDYEIEQELHKRARFKRFIVLVPGKGAQSPGKEVIDIDKSLDLLKKARKMEIPQVASFDGKILQVFRITELNPEDRKTELCPICGKPLFQGYCQDCGLDFGGIGMDERSYIRLVTKKETFNVSSFSDRRAIHASATKGLEDLKLTWPSVAPEFDDLKVSNNLPQLVIMKPVLSEKKKDPFHVDGNRSY